MRRDWRTVHRPWSRVAGIVLALGVVGIAMWAWERRMPVRWAAVEEGCLYRSGRLPAALVGKVLRDHGIKVIVALNAEASDDVDDLAERKAAGDLGVELLRFPLRGDGTGEVDHYIAAVAAIARARQQGKCVLVHCIAGSQRTGGVIACYQLLVENRTPAEALREMKRGGWRTRDVALTAYINANLAVIAAGLHDQGIIAAVPNPLPALAAGR